MFVRDGEAWSQQAYVKASNTDADDLFGVAVGLSDDGDTLVVGAPLEDSRATGIDGDQEDNWGLKAGAAYVFVREGDVWSQQAYVKPSNTDGAELFGTSLSLSGDGDTLAVGARWEDSNATGVGGDEDDDSATYAGAVYVFGRDGDTWSQHAYLKASNTGEGDLFGTSVALSSDGDTLAVGASGEASDATGINGDQGSNSAPGAGAVYVFGRDGDMWTQQAYVKASNTNGDDLFGANVALSSSGATLAVSAQGEASDATGVGGDEDDNSAPGAGAVYVFVRDGDTWSQKVYVKASNTHGGDLFGSGNQGTADMLKSDVSNLAISGDGSVMAVGSPRDNSGAKGPGVEPESTAFDSGAVYLY